MPSFWEKQYNSLSTFGKWTTIFFSCIIIFICIIILIFMYPMYFNPIYTSSTIATVTSIEICSPVTIIQTMNGVTTSKIQYNCSGKMTYIIDGTKYENNYNENNLISPSSIGKTLEIYYNPKNPKDIGQSASSEKKTALIVSIICLLVILFALIKIYLVYKYQFFAAASGADTTASFFGWFGNRYV